MAPAKGTLVCGGDGVVGQAGCSVVAKGLGRVSGWAMWQEREGLEPWSLHGSLWRGEKDALVWSSTSLAPIKGDTQSGGVHMNSAWLLNTF